MIKNTTSPYLLPFVFLTAMTFSLSHVTAQTNGVVKGIVTLGGNRDLAAGAHVVLPAMNRGTSADQHGRFVMRNIPEGTYAIEIRYIGYRPEKLHVVVTEGKESTLEVNLTETPFPLDEVVVTGSLTKHKLKDTPVITEVISQKDLAGYGSSDLADIMGAQTGIEISTGIGQTHSAQLHGLSDNHVLVLVDGERVTGRVDGAVDLGQIPLNTIDKIEVVKGPLSSVYGSEAIGGVVNIITKDPGFASKINLSTTLGSYGRQDYELMAANGFRNAFGDNTSARFALTTGWNKFFGVDYNPFDNFMEMPEYDRKNIGVTSFFDFGHTASVNLKGQYYKDRSEWMAGDSTVYLNDISTNEKWSTVAQGQYRVSQALDLKVTANLSHNTHGSSEVSANGTATRNDASKEEVRTYRTQLSYIPYASSLLTGGYEYDFESANSTRIQGGVRNYINNILFFEDEWAFTSFMVTAGGRYSNNSVYGEFFSPRLSAMYKATDNITFRASYGKGFRAPSINELFIDFANTGVGYTVIGEPSLRPEKSDGYNAGMQYTRDDLVWFRVNFYYNKLENLIDYYVKSASPITLTYHNITEAVTKGVDIDVDLHPFEQWTLSIGYAYTFAQDGKGRDLPFRSPNLANWKIQYTEQELGLTANIRGRWFDRKLVTDEQTNLDIYNGGGSAKFFYVPAYMILDLKVGKKIFDNFELSAGMNNIGDVTHYPFGQIKGREIFGGIAFTVK
jgi:outer membrane receptor for ferrienterochelin and colicins